MISLLCPVINGFEGRDGPMRADLSEKAGFDKNHWAV
jgi:hypothetical protein